MLLHLFAYRSARPVRPKSPLKRVKPSLRFGVLSVTLSVVIFFAAAPVFGDDTGSIPVGPTASLNERVLKIPGDPERPATLEVTVLSPDGPGPFPLAVINHGADGKRRPRDQPRYRLTYAAFYFLSRGYAVALPMMRGFAGSEGQIVGHKCNAALTGVENAKDIAAVINYMGFQSYVDGTRVIVSGQSFGGWNTLATGALVLPNVKALVNFAGGMVESDCDNTKASLVKGAELFGAHTAVPSIWFYGDNDKLFPPAIWHPMFEHYNAAGGKARLVDFGVFRDDAHQMLSFSAGLPLWMPKLDGFLTEIGLPSKSLYPGYMPTPTPKPTGYAAINDVESVPYIGEPGKALYQRFLSAPPPRALAIAANGMAASSAGGFDPIVEALARCKQHAEHCELYAVDDEVVWSHPTPTPPATSFAALSDASAIPYVKDKGREGYQQFLTLRKPRAFVISPEGSWSASSRGPDPLATALENCSKAHKDCHFYAIDDDVVWPQH